MDKVSMTGIMHNDVIKSKITYWCTFRSTGLDFKCLLFMFASAQRRTKMDKNGRMKYKIADLKRPNTKVKSVNAERQKTSTSKECEICAVPNVDPSAVTAL